MLNASVAYFQALLPPEGLTHPWSLDSMTSYLIETSGKDD